MLLGLVIILILVVVFYCVIDPDIRKYLLFEFKKWRMERETSDGHVRSTSTVGLSELLREGGFKYTEEDMVRINQEHQDRVRGLKKECDFLVNRLEVATQQCGRFKQNREDCLRSDVERSWW